MKHSHRITAAVLVSAGLTLAAFSAHADTVPAGGPGHGMTGGMGHAMMPRMAQQHQAMAGAGHQGRMGGGHQGAAGAQQQGRADAGGCPMMSAAAGGQAEHKH